MFREKLKITPHNMGVVNTAPLWHFRNGVVGGAIIYPQIIHKVIHKEKLYQKAP
jgi:hypothetical protein